MRAAAPISAASVLVLALAVLAAPAPAWPQVDAALLRYPDVSARHVAFVYAGDVWVVAKEGGTARRLSSPRGEESFPRFSPDGEQIAFSGNYDGNVDVYVVPTLGGEPRRLTHHPETDRLVDWTPDGASLLFASPRESGSEAFNQLYRVSVSGGLPEKLPLAYAEVGALAPDGKTLAFQYIRRDTATWKRYRGGYAPDLWLFDLETLASENLTRHDANDSQPMWHGSTLYFLSDRDANLRANLFALDMESRELRQVTAFADFDVRLPAIGPADIVFEHGGRLHLLDLATETHRPVEIKVVTDRATLKPRSEPVADLIAGAGISPTGKRAVFEARGEVFTVPAEHGIVRNLTRSSGAAERYPAWSPDGETIAYFTDRGGEYELAVRPADGSGEEEVLSAFGPGFRYRPFFSPDSRRVAFVDQRLKLKIFDLETREARDVDTLVWLTHGGLQGFRPSWSADGRWLAYPRLTDNQQSAIVLYDVEAGERRQVTSGYYSDSGPAFDPDGKVLYFLTNRHFEPAYSDVDGTWIYANTTQVAAVPLRRDVPYPLAPRNDEEGEDDDKEDRDDGDEAGETRKGKKARKGKKGEAGKPGEDGEDERKEPVEIDLDGFESRVQVLPLEAGNYRGLHAVSGKLVVHRGARTGAGDGAPSPLVYWDLEEREETTILGDVDHFAVSADGKKVLVEKDGAFAIVDVAASQEMKKPLATGELETVVDPAAEWRQIFDDVWRLMRDLFYDPGMHGVDWPAMREHYGSLLEHAVTRWDVSYVIGELIGELNASHSYRFGGDVEQAPERGVGLLGADFRLEDGAYRIARILAGGPWDSEARSPLALAGVREGEVLLAVNGVAIDVSRDPWAAFEGLAGKTVALTVNDRPSPEGARDVLVETLRTERRLRDLAWIESNRRRVEEATGGRVGYLYVPDTGRSGQSELVRQFHAQVHKDGLIVDERFNAGGQYPDRFVELLDRRRTGYIGFRETRPLHLSPQSRTGPQVMLINSWAGSGGDLFPYLFKEAGLGPLIGTRTWGGLIGISGGPQLIDGGGVTTPNLALYGLDGEWLIEGHGVEPDVEVVEDPTALAKGVDPQLERAIEEVLRLLEEQPPVFVDPPPFDDRTARGPG